MAAGIKCPSDTGCREQKFSIAASPNKLRALGSSECCWAQKSEAVRRREQLINMFPTRQLVSLGCSCGLLWPEMWWVFQAAFKSCLKHIGFAVGSPPYTCPSEEVVGWTSGEMAEWSAAGRRQLWEADSDFIEVGRLGMCSDTTLVTLRDFFSLRSEKKITTNASSLVLQYLQLFPPPVLFFIGR